MRTQRVVGSVLALLVLAGCGSTPPAPMQPKLAGVSLVGHQLCGDLTTGGQTFSGQCLPLPTVDHTSWVLTPAWTPSIAAPTRQHLNRIVTATVTTPSLTDLDVELVRPNQQPNRLLTNVGLTRPGNPGEVGNAGEVSVANQDNGTTKTWTVEVNISGCIDFRTIQIFNRSGSARSNPLTLDLLRDPADEVCVGGGGGVLSGGVSGGPSPGTQTGPKPSGPCPGGAATRLFNVCENCANLHPQSANVYTGYEGCDWTEVLNVFGYTGPTSTKAQLCTIRESASQADCEGPP